MASDRDGALSSATAVEETDSELGEVLAQANNLHLELVKENNRHKEQMASGERGWFGQFLGGERNAPTVVAFIALVLFSAIGSVCLAAAYNNPETGTFWGDHARNAFALATGALGFIFGRGSTPKE